MPEPLPIDAPLHACFSEAQRQQLAPLLLAAALSLSDASDIITRHPEAGHPAVLALQTHLRMLNRGVARAATELTPPRDPPDAV